MSQSLADIPNDTPPEAEAPKEPEWYFAEGIPGQGPKPDYLEPKYRTLADQAKAYKEAQKLLGSTKAAPEEYQFGELQEIIDRENPHIKEFMDFAKENRFQQDTFEKILKTYANYDKSRQPNIDEEIEKIGPQGKEKINAIQNWVKNNLTQDSQKALEKLPVKAEVVKMLDELRQMHVHMHSKVPAGDKSIPQFSPLTLKEIEAEMLLNQKRYLEDPGYRAQISAKIQQVVGE